MGAELPPPPPTRQRAVPLPRTSWLMLVVATGLALGAIAVFPRSGGDAPPLASLALIGAVIAAVTTAALYAIVRRDLRLPSRAAISLVVAFGLIGLVKFVLAPQGLYEVNAVRALDDFFGTVADPGGAAITAAAVFGLYAFGYWLVSRVVLGDRTPIRRRTARRARSPVGVGSVVLGIAATGLLAVSGAWILVLAVLTAPRQYLEFVFTSGAGVLTAVALAAAATLIGVAFRALAREPRVVAEAGAIVTLFWLGLGFLALYHALWIVYVLVLGSIWPLKTVVPK